MTTEEFKKELKELGLSLHSYSTDFQYCYIEDENGNGNVYAQVDYAREYVSTIGTEKTFSDPEKQRKLFNVVTKYSATPIEERASKRYFKYRLNPIAEKAIDRYLSFSDCFKIFDVQTWGMSEERKIFEENDPLLDGVNLEMFEAIEVDREGNEIHD